MSYLQNVATNVGEQTIETMLTNPLGMGMQNIRTMETLGNALGRPGVAQDAISRFLPPSNQSLMPFPMPIVNPLNPLGSLIEVIKALLAQLQQPQSGQGSFGDREQWFGNATGGSNGDPHLSFNGSTWDSMVPHDDLLHSDSIPGGFQISTETTTPAANGITYNRAATVTTNFGNSSVSLDNAGNAVATINGDTIQLAPGSSAELSPGTVATRNQDGSLSVIAEDGQGGKITTTLRNNGQGVDVNATAQNVDLGGDLVAAQNSNPGGVLETMKHRHHWHNYNTAMEYGNGLNFE